MAGRKATEPKLAALRERRTLNPRPERVTDALFQQSAFFDARDLPQVKYEMIRRVEVDHVAVADAAAAFGLSRQSFYGARAVVARDGFAGLLPRKPGPRGAHKLRPDVMAFLAKRRAADPSLSLVALVPLVKNRFGVVVHPRSIELAWRRQSKNGRDLLPYPPSSPDRGRPSPRATKSCAVPRSARLRARGAGRGIGRSQASRQSLDGIRPRGAWLLP